MILGFFFFSGMLGFRDFSKLEEIKNYISSNFPNIPSENINISGALIIFDSSLQKTWLILTEKRLFCVLDDLRKDTFEVRWHLSKNEIMKNNKVVLEINVNPNYKHKTGLVDFGKNHRDWLYSKKLFDSPDKLREKLKDFIASKMASPQSFGEQTNNFISGGGLPPDLTS